MPELPEVEVTRRSIATRLLGGRVVSVRCGKPLRWPLGCAPEALLGSQMGEVARRGKYLWLPLQRNTMHQPAGQDGGLLIHLGMSGSLALHDAAVEPGPHAHFDLGTTHGLLRLTDPRRFGAVLWSRGLC
jgi:formamidopyrimidine-DNA glycosylase